MANRKIYDAHVHIMPEHLLGAVDPLGISFDKFGVWTFDNKIKIQRMPPYFENSCFSADALIAMMDAYGIEKANIMQSYMFRINEDIADAIAKYPGRIYGAMFIDPRDKDVADQITGWHNKGLNIIKLEMKGYTHPKAYPEIKLDSDTLMHVFDVAEKENLTITIDTDEVFGPGYQVEELKRAITSHKSLRFVICHFGFAQYVYLSDQRKMARWKEMLDLAKYENVWIDISAMPDLFREERYPFPKCLQLFGEFVDKYGTSKAIWGSDMPGTFTTATYTEMINMFEEAPNLSEECKNHLFYDNAMAAYSCD